MHLLRKNNPSLVADSEDPSNSSSVPFTTCLESLASVSQASASSPSEDSTPSVQHQSPVQNDLALMKHFKTREMDTNSPHTETDMDVDMGTATRSPHVSILPTTGVPLATAAPGIDVADIKRIVPDNTPTMPLRSGSRPPPPPPNLTLQH
ncbi:hypothetical protein L2E82_38698 [Cichorium intybus]|uniref:Uncharacterized protein n=1 Tax=Cichorium intybus TaxID=13427 RepID=A0ACB9AGB9_CICIN|nr:hypothetical protein L2E82_38698 [Cichorium intybus]